MNTDLVNIAHQFKFNTGLFKRIVEPIPPERWLEKPGTDSNHLMWIAGHLLHSRAQVLSTLGVDVPLPSATLFRRGAKLAAPEQYPKTTEIIQAWDEVSDKLALALEGVAADELGKPAPQGGAPSFDGKISGTIAFFALHETYHIGQIGFLKKWLGYGQTVG